MTSLRAALHPASGNNLFFVAKKDGTHAFAKTYIGKMTSFAKLVIL
jgi:UPF0755 protein